MGNIQELTCLRNNKANPALEKYQKMQRKGTIIIKP
jgi:hypothetical protein